MITARKDRAEIGILQMSMLFNSDQQYKGWPIGRVTGNLAIYGMPQNAYHYRK